MSRFEQTSHGRYIIRSGPGGGGWQARALQGKRPIGDVQTGNSREGAIQKVRELLDSREADIIASRGADGSPSAREYAEAFGRIGKLPQSYEAMLDAHLDAPNLLITATELAAAAGFENYNAANLHYGKLGLMLSEEIGWQPPRRNDGTPIWTGVLATPGNMHSADETDWEELYARGDDGQFQWRLRPQVVQALTAE